MKFVAARLSPRWRPTPSFSVRTPGRARRETSGTPGGPCNDNRPPGREFAAPEPAPRPPRPTGRCPFRWWPTRRRSTCNCAGPRRPSQQAALLNALQPGRLPAGRRRWAAMISIHRAVPKQHVCGAWRRTCPMACRADRDAELGSGRPARHDQIISAQRDAGQRLGAGFATSARRRSPSL